MKPFIDENFHKYINSELKASKIYEYFCDALAHRYDVVNAISKDRALWLYNSKSKIFDQLIDRRLFMIFDLSNKYKLYGDNAWCAIADGGNEVLINGSFTTSDDGSLYSELTHVKYFNNDFGPIKKGESLLINRSSDSFKDDDTYVVHVNSDNETILNTQFMLYQGDKKPSQYPSIYDYIEERESKNMTKKKEL